MAATAQTLFDDEPEVDEPLALCLTGYMRASDITVPPTRCGQKPMEQYHLDVEIFRTTREGIERYMWEAERFIR